MHGVLARLQSEGSVMSVAPPWRASGGLWFSTPEAGDRAMARIAECREARAKPVVEKRPFSKGAPKGGRNPDYMTMECVREEVVRLLESRPMSEADIERAMGRTRPLKKQMRALLEEGTVRHVLVDGKWLWSLPDPMD